MNQNIIVAVDHSAQSENAVKCEYLCIYVYAYFVQLWYNNASFSCTHVWATFSISPSTNYGTFVRERKCLLVPVYGIFYTIWYTNLFDR